MSSRAPILLYAKPKSHLKKKSEIFGLPWSFILVWRAGAREGEVDIDR